MSFTSKLFVRQTVLVSQTYRSNIARQTRLPFSITSRSATDGVNKDKKQEHKSFDSVPIHLTAGGKIIMVLGGLYSRYGDVPDSIPNRVYQKTKDKFRARCVILSVFGTGLLAFIAAQRGRKARDEGKRYTDDVYTMHHGQSRLHNQIEHPSKQRRHAEDLSSPIQETNK